MPGTLALFMVKEHNTTMSLHVLIKHPISTAGATPSFILRNLWCGRQLVPFAPAQFGAFVIEAMRPEALEAVARNYTLLTQGGRLERKKLAVLRLLGPRLCLVARAAGPGDILGMAIYYFNQRDRKDNTIHEGYIGLHEAMRGRHLGTFMRQHALAHFSMSGLSGMSSRVSSGNLPSLRSGMKLGFEVAETYFDHSLGEERHYLICDFRRNIEQSNTFKGKPHQ